MVALSVLAKRLKHPLTTIHWLNIEGRFSQMKRQELIQRYARGERNFSKANLSWANLSEADLSGAGLSETTVTDEQLPQAKSLKGVTLPDGTKHA